VAKWLGGWVGCVNAGLFFFFFSLLLLLLFLLSLRLTGLLKGRLGGGCAITQQQQPRK
jgi:hypothetical protein